MTASIIVKPASARRERRAVPFLRRRRIAVVDMAVLSIVVGVRAEAA
jgi:hypothetical protein